MNPITPEEAQALIPEFGLVDLDRMFRHLTEGKNDDSINIHYCAHGDELRGWLEGCDDAIHKDAIIDAPFMGDLLVTHFAVVGGWFSVIHRKIEEEILSFPFANDGDGWIPAPMMTYISRSEFKSKSFLPPRLSDGYNMGVGDWCPDTAKAILGRVIAASLMLALKDETEPVN